MHYAYTYLYVTIRAHVTLICAHIPASLRPFTHASVRASFHSSSKLHSKPGDPHPIPGILAARFRVAPQDLGGERGARVRHGENWVGVRHAGAKGSDERLGLLDCLEKSYQIESLNNGTLLENEE